MMEKKITELLILLLFYVMKLIHKIQSLLLIRRKMLHSPIGATTKVILSWDALSFLIAMMLAEAITIRKVMACSWTILFAHTCN